MKTEQVAEVCSTVGNLIRLVAVVELDEIVAVCAKAEANPSEICLLDPRETPSSLEDHVKNSELLKAFAQFRWDIEMIRQGTMTQRREQENEN